MKRVYYNGRVSNPCFDVDRKTGQWANSCHQLILKNKDPSFAKDNRQNQGDAKLEQLVTEYEYEIKKNV